MSPENTTMPALANAHALVIGSADYANIRKLPKVRDAEDLAAAIGDPSLCGYAPKNVTVLLDSEATRDKIRAAFEALKARCNAAGNLGTPGIRDLGTPYLVCFDVLRVIAPRLQVTRQ
jgi:hypothetical protein